MSAQLTELSTQHQQESQDLDALPRLACMLVRWLADCVLVVTTQEAILEFPPHSQIGRYYSPHS